MLPIIIIGCGISSLTLANALLPHGIPFLIFEREADLTHRHQGYRFRLHREALQALQEVCEANSPELWEKCQAAFAMDVPPRVEMDAWTGDIIDVDRMNGTRSHSIDHVNATDDRRHIDRSVLRHVLISNVLPFVVFGRRFTHYKIGSNVTAHFETGDSVEGSLLVGGDGGRSRVARQLIPNVKYHDLGMMVIFGKTPCSRESQLPEELRRGMVYMRAPRKDGLLTLFTETIRFDPRMREKYPDLPIPEDYIFFGFLGQKHLYGDGADPMAAANQLTPAGRADLVLHLTREFHPRLRTVVEQQDRNAPTIGSFTTADPHSLPIWQTDPRVTILGDAYHAVSAVASMGANLALRSGQKLGQLLARDRPTGTAWDVSTLAEFEDWMRETTQPIIRIAYENTVMEFGAIPHPNYCNA